MNDRATAGVYGKLPSQPDFFRAGAGAFCQAGLDRWLQEGVEVLRSERTALTPEPVAFLLAPQGSKSAFAGVLVTSADAAGRSFPLAAFAEISAVEAKERLPLVPAACAAFVRDAAAVLAAAATMDGAALAGKAQALAGPPSPSSAPDRWSNRPARELSLLFGDSPKAVAYALRTLVTACERSAQGGANPSAALTVDAPTSGSETSALWLDIVSRRIAGSGAPAAFATSLLWTNEPNGRLLVTLGPMSPSALAYVANPRHRSSRFWPLRTDAVAATEQAWAALGAQQQRAIEEPASSLGGLAAVF
jgi:type VI secretion system ImpM family protein